MIDSNALKVIEEELKLRNEDYRPYSKQREFHNTVKRERVLSAGNQLGKSEAGAFEAKCHLTGIYPSWWEGVRFDRAITMFIGAENYQQVRDSVQRKLFGKIKEVGTGMIHPDVMDSFKEVPNAGGALDWVKIKHVSGETSTLVFKTYKMGRDPWQAVSCDAIWLDEEPKEDIYQEAKSRINGVEDGIFYMTFTPLKGLTPVVHQFWNEEHPNRSLVRMSINDAEHISPEHKKILIASYPEHQRKARIEGLPVMGEGLIYPVSRESIEEDRIKIPRHWARLCGIDFGWTHPTTAVWIAHDRDNDVVHIYDCYKKSQADVKTNAKAILSGGDWIPIAWPHDGLQHQKGEGKTLASMYADEGLNMLGKVAQFEDKGNGVEAGIMMILDRMNTGRLKVARHLEGWFEEFVMYHRKEGKIHKEKDDLMDATRYAIMMLRFSMSEAESDYVDSDEEYSHQQRNEISGY